MMHRRQLLSLKLARVFALMQKSDWNVANLFNPNVWLMDHVMCILGSYGKLFLDFAQTS